MSLVDHAILPSRSYPWKRGAGETLAPLLLPVAFPLLPIASLFLFGLGTALVESLLRFPQVFAVFTVWVRAIW